jgi:hypothetical protein
MLYLALALDGCSQLHTLAGVTANWTGGWVDLKTALDQWFQPGVRVPPGVREDILGGAQNLKKKIIIIL